MEAANPRWGESVRELTPATGRVTWTCGAQQLEAEALCTRSQRVSPATALHPQLTIEELIAFQGQFLPWSSPSAAQDLIQRAGLKATRIKPTEI